MAIDRTWYNTLTDDSGSGTDGSVWDKADVGSLLDTIDNEPRCSAYNTAVQSVSDSTFTALSLNAEDYDVGTMHSTVTNNSRVAVPSAGLYVITAQVAFATSGTGTRSVQLRKNGGTALCYQQLPANSAALTIVNVTFIAALSAADYVEVLAFQSSGGALNTGAVTRDSANHLQVAKIR